LCDPNAEARYNICHALKVEIHETNEVSLLERRNVDAVVIASPDRFHLDSLVRAVKAGKHVLCEKPMVTSEEELSRLRTVLELALASNLVVTSCHPRRFDHPYTILKQRLPEFVSQFGNILAVELDFSYHKPSKQGLHQGLLIDHISQV
jgi:predicted dehydrogenase